jgi:glycosyltransferase involved in cell wall biosynthesis
LKSALTYIDAIVISDTGSTDNTISVIRKFAEENNLPYQVTSDTWVNYAKNRTIALEHAKSLYKDDSWYILFMDADTRLYITTPKSDLTKDLYLVEMRRGNGTSSIMYRGNLFVRSTKAINWRCPVHEYLATNHSSEAVVSGYLDNNQRGYRVNDKYTMAKDIIMLRAGLLDPNDVDIHDRITFYIARTYHDMSNTVKSRKWFDKLLENYSNTWTEHRYVACILIFIDDPSADNLSYLFDAMEINPERMEAYTLAIRYFCLAKKYRAAYAIGHTVIDKINRVDSSFLTVRVDLSTYLFDFWMAMACYYVGQKKEATRLNNRCLSLMPENDSNRVQAISNSKFYV